MYTRNCGTRTQRKKEEMRGSLRWLADARDSGGIVLVVDAQRPVTRHAGLAGVTRRPLIRWSSLLKSHVHHDHRSLSQQGRQLCERGNAPWHCRRHRYCGCCCCCPATGDAPGVLERTLAWKWQKWVFQRLGNHRRSDLFWPHERNQPLQTRRTPVTYCFSPMLPPRLPQRPVEAVGHCRPRCWSWGWWG